MITKNDKHEVRFGLMDYISDQIFHFGVMPNDMIFNIYEEDEFTVLFSEYKNYLTNEDWMSIEKMFIESDDR